MPTPAASFNEKPVTYTYYPNGQRETMTDASGTTTYTYDNQNRLLTKTTTLAGTLTYTYDKAGNRLTVSSSNTNGTSVVYTYDNLNRLETVVDNNAEPGQKLTAYSYDPVGNLASTALANGVVATPSVDQMNRVTDLLTVRQAAGAGTVSAYSYLYGPVGNRTYAAGSAGGPQVSSTYGYDSIYRLTQESVSSAGVQAENGALTYGLDAVGNRKSLASTLTGIGAQAATYDANDRVVGISYDANGNMLGAGGTANVFDSQDRLVSFNGGAATMVYDGDGNRVSKTAAGATTVYLVDEANPTGLPQVAEELSSGGVVQRRYLYGLQRIAQTQVATAATSFYGYDGHGDVRYLMDVTGAVTDTYDYDAFGNVVGSTGATANVYRYQGEAFDAETGLYYLRARYYDPVAGRFLSVDQMADQGQHPYAYAGADPVNGHDPTGTQDIIEYALAAAMFKSMFAPVVGMREDITCLWGLTKSIMSNPLGLLHRVAACQVATVPQRPGTPGPGSPNGPPPRRPAGPQCRSSDCDWINKYGDDASQVAAGLGMDPIKGVAEILGVSALESGWGSGNFASNRRNDFFNLESTSTTKVPNPPLFPFSTGWYAASGSKALVATYASYLDSARSFAAIDGKFIQGVNDPTDFATRLQKLAKFGIGPNGPDPTFVPKVVSITKDLLKCLQ
jgi:RHS repeat-associated protein